MTIKSIEAALNEFCKSYGNSRLQYCRPVISTLEDGVCKLTGDLLDEETKSAVQNALSSAFPAIEFDLGEIHVLRKSPPKLMAVSTNVAGIHRGPARISELLSQNVNGVIVEDLQREDSGWIFTRQTDGYLGWMVKPYLTDQIPVQKPKHLVSAPVAHLLASPGEEDTLVSRVFAGTAVHVIETSSAWSHIEQAGEHSGWVSSSALCPLENLPTAEKERREKMILDSKSYIGVPYRWGGGTVNGIDCSGLVQLLHKLSGVTLPRDADMQFAAAAPVEPPFQPGDLLYFGSSQNGHRSITHVAMSLGGWRIIHSSGSRNGVYEDDVRAVSWLGDRFVGANTFQNF
jgi:SH3-like domain-containing protein